MTKVFDSILDALESLDSELVNYGDTLMHSAQVEDEMVALNKEQLDQGIRADGTKIGEYSIKTISRKRKLGQRFDYITLKDTGDWQNAMEVEHSNGKVEILSRDWKDEMLQTEYGNLIEGLTDDHIEVIKQDLLLPQFIEHAKVHLENNLR